MSENQEMTWNDDGFGGKGKKKANKDIWLKLVDGSNELRIVTNPYPYWSHKYKKEGDPGFGRKINCAKHKKDDFCPLCEMGDKAKPRYFFGVIDRRTNSYRIIDVSSGVFQKIKVLVANTKHYGDPTQYDVDLVVNKNADPANYYNIVGLSKSPLSGSDQKMKDEANLDELKQRAAPLEVEKIHKILDWINNPRDEKTNAPEATVQSKSEEKKTSAPLKKVAPKAKSSPVDDDQDEFPPFKG